jgi:hypothetical protein
VVIYLSVLPSPLSTVRAVFFFHFQPFKHQFLFFWKLLFYSMSAWHYTQHAHWLAIAIFPFKLSMQKFGASRELVSKQKRPKKALKVCKYLVIFLMYHSFSIYNGNDLSLHQHLSATPSLTPCLSSCIAAAESLTTCANACIHISFLYFYYFNNK